MVYFGKPSTACDTCRKRRIKCDEARPSCGQCLRTSRSCAGYPNSLDVLFRNETAAVKHRAQRAFSIALRKRNLKYENADRCKTSSATPPPSASFPTSLAHAPHSRSSSESESEIPGPIALDSAGARLDYAVGWLFRALVAGRARLDMQAAEAESARGCLAILAPMYVSARPGGVLHGATHALALAMVANGRKNSAMRGEAREVYGAALRALSRAINAGEGEEAGNEVLMAIMLFSLYEEVTSTEKSRAAWMRHIDGAVALVKLRGVEVLRERESRHLFRAVRASMLTASIQQGKPLADFPSPQGWHCDADYDINAANRLTIVCLPLPALKAQVQTLLTTPTPPSLERITALISQISALDTALATWANTLDTHLAARITRLVPPTTLSPSASAAELDDALAWPGPVLAYPTVFVANLWNEYRVYRILCQALVQSCIAALAAKSPGGMSPLDDVAARAAYTTQGMADEICATLPFLLGQDREGGPTSVLPVAVGQDEAAARGTGAYFAIWPLTVLEKVPTLGGGQKRWVAGRLRFVRRTYGFSEDYYPVGRGFEGGSVGGEEKMQGKAQVKVVDGNGKGKQRESSFDDGGGSACVTPVEVQRGFEGVMC
ncbi:hypothetical protein EJ06DRAFT_527201 [Trichodelitschia bisporula]|uniref:Zn(2)-C6 fungal-type domain-containing protein n=1 Tax=Trichodelitschia bisporula TaxID=703511 RepID=A0A6G1I5L4_9PEZI|nr:hypothetical protein EJ06DRAFT_527201 [Trichodelitschia bisporula]